MSFGTFLYRYVSDKVCNKRYQVSHRSVLQIYFLSNIKRINGPDVTWYFFKEFIEII